MYVCIYTYLMTVHENLSGSEEDRENSPSPLSCIPHKQVKPQRCGSKRFGVVANFSSITFEFGISNITSKLSITEPLIECTMTTGGSFVDAHAHSYSE